MSESNELSRDAAARAFIERARQVLKPATRHSDAGQVSLVFRVLFLCAFAVLLPAFVAYQFDLTANTLPKSIFAETAEQAEQAKTLEGKLKAGLGKTRLQIAQQCNDDGACDAEKLAEALAAKAALENTAAAKSGRRSALASFSTTVQRQIVLAAMLGLAFVILLAQSRFIWRFITWSAEGDRQILPVGDDKYLSQSEMDGGTFAALVIVPVVVFLLLVALFKTGFIRAPLWVEWVIILSGALVLLFLGRAPARTSSNDLRGRYAMGYVMVGAALLGIIAVEVAPTVVPSFQRLLDGLPEFSILLFHIGAALVAMNVAVALWGAQCFVESYPKTGDALELYFRTQRFEEVESQLKAAKKATESGTKKPEPAPAGTSDEAAAREASGGGATDTPTTVGIWQAMLAVMAQEHPGQGDWPARLHVDANLKATALIGSVRSIAVALALVLVVTLVALVVLIQQRTGSLALGHAPIKAALQDAIGNFSLYVGLGYSLIVATVFYHAENRLGPYVEVEGEKSDAPKTSGGFETPDPWIVQSSSADGKIDIETKVTGHIFHPNWLEEQQAKREKAKNEAKFKGQLAAYEERLASHIGMTRSKLLVVLNGAFRGAKLQENIRKNGKDYIVPILTMLAPTAVGGFLKLF